MKVVHIITGLDLAGAETVLYKLLSGTEGGEILSEVISLTDIGEIGQKIKSLGVPVRALGMRRGLPPNPFKILRLAVWLRRARPDLIQTWMYHADLVGGVAAKLSGGAPVVWGVHHFNLEPKYNKTSTIITAKLCAKLSTWLPVKIVCCSDAARFAHVGIGYATSKIVVIQNGIDTSLFKPDPGAHKNIRAELGVTENTLLIGMVARFDSQKDHENFVHAAGLLASENPGVHFVLCGKGITWDNKQLVCWIESARIKDRIHLLDVRQDVQRVTAALSVATLSSYGESFSLMLGEAMSCKVPCVTTDIAAAVDLLGGYGWVVPIHEPVSLCGAWKEILSLSDDDITGRLEAARKRIHDNYSLESMVQKYLCLYEELNKLNKSTDLSN